MNRSAYPESFSRELATIAARGRQIWQLIPRPQRRTLWLAVSLMALGGAANTAVPLLLGRLVNTVQDNTVAPGGFAAVAAVFLGLIGAAYLLREALQVARRFLVEDTSTRLEKHLFVTLVGHLLRADLEKLSQDKVGALHGRMHRSVGGSVRFLRVGFLDFLPALLSGSLALAAVAIKQPWLGLLMAGVVPLSLTVTVRQLISQKGVRLDLLRSREELDGTVVEQLGGIDYIRAANTHDREAERVARAAESLRAKELRHHFVMSLYGSTKAVVEGLFHVLVLGFAVYLAATGQIRVGDILAFSMLFLSVMAPLNEIHRVIDEGHEASLLVGELLKMLAEPCDRSFQRAAPQTPERSHNGDVCLQLENLLVEYESPDGSRKRAVDDVSLTIRRGEIVGIAGRSGCGKTTLLRTLLRLVHPSGGTVLLDGVPLESVSREDVARLIGYVAQTPFVFSGTIAENIAYERESATADELRRAAAAACLDGDIDALPGGFQSPVLERGKNLSGGQQQRLALARVLLKSPPILILDEATSALDTISERRIQEALTATRGSRTVILVAHRLSTLLHTDRILVFENGRIVESGAYADLVGRNGVFATLVRSAAAR